MDSEYLETVYQTVLEALRSVQDNSQTENWKKNREVRSIVSRALSELGLDDMCGCPLCQS